MAVQEATLHDETLSELGLSKQPFLDDKKLQRFADSETQRTRAALEQHLRFGDSLHLLIGEEGAGKTVLLSQLIKHCKSSIKPFVVKGSDEFIAEGFLHAILQQLDSDAVAGSVDEYIDKLTPHFERIRDDQYSVVLAVDDAHLAPMEEIAELVDITRHFESENGKTARLLLTGRPSLKHAISKIEQQVAELDLHYSTNTIEPMDEARVRDYLSSRLNQAGFADAFPFTDKAITKIQRDSSGLPANVNSAATHYLNGVYRGAEAGVAGTAVKSSGLAGFSWPMIAVGAAALGAIAWGLSLFLGDKPVTQVMPVEEVVQLEQPAVIQSDEQIGAQIDAQPIVEPTSAGVAPQDQLLISEENVATDTTVASSATDLVTTTPQVQPQPVAVASSDLQQNDANNQTVAQSVDQSQKPEITVPGPTDFETTTPDKNITQRAAISAPANTPEVATPALAAAINNTDELLAGNNTAPTNNIIDPSEGVEVPVDNTPGTQPIQNNTGLVGDASTESGVEVNTPSRSIENENWVLFQSPTKFTVQLATSRERGYIIDLAQNMDVTGPVAIYPFLTTNSKNPVFGLLNGVYDTRDEATAAVDAMSENAKQFGIWIRPISDLHAEIKPKK